MSRLKVRLFVESVEAFTGESSKTIGTRRGKWVAEPGIAGKGKVFEDSLGPSPGHGSGSLFGQGAHGFVLPAEQREAVEIVRRVASRASLDFEVVDLGKMNVFHRAFQKRFGKIRTFPTLVLSSGKRIEGSMTEQQVIQLLPGAAKKESIVLSIYNPSKNTAFPKITKSSVPFYDKLLVFLRFVFFLEKDPKHGTMQSDALVMHLEVICVLIMIPLAVTCLYVWVNYGFAFCLASVALIAFALIEIFHFAFDR